MRRILPLLPLLLVPALEAGAVEQVSIDADVAACVQRDLLEPDSVRGVRISSRGRGGETRVTTVMFYGRRGADGARKLLVRFLRPDELRGSSVLLLESQGASEVYLATPELGAPKRISGSGRATPLFGTDFSYEDLQYLEGFIQPGSWTRTKDSELSGRPVYVVEVKPADSGYDSIVTYVDKESCLPLKIKFYERRHFVRKELTIDAGSIKKVGSSWVPHSILIRDRRDRTTTQIMVDRSEQDPLPEEFFAVDQLLIAQP